MSTAELIDRLCAVNVLLTDIVREQAAIMQQHGIDIVDGGLPERVRRAEDENDLLEQALRPTTTERV